MKIRSMVEALHLIGHRVRYMRRGGSRFGWEGVIDHANTQKVRVVWDRPDGEHMTQEYQMSSLYRENGEDDNGTTYILILTDESDDKGSIESGGEWRRIEENEYPGVKNCPGCGRRPLIQRWVMGASRLIVCCDYLPKKREDWNRYSENVAVGCAAPRQEAVEHYEGVAYESQRPQETSFADTGRQIERFGKLLQNPQVRLNELAWEARKAGFNLRISIQPKGEVTTNGDAETP